MASISRELTTLKCIRNAGVPHPQQPTVRVGGTYHPAHTNAGGVAVSARWDGTFAINHKGYKNAQNQPVEGKRDFIRISAWSGKNPGANGGMAEHFARIMSPGLEICLDAHLQTYDGDVYDNNVRVCRPDGTPITTRKIGFVAVPNSLIICEESEKHIMDEIQKGLRPANFRNRAHPDFQIWGQVIAKKNAEQYIQGNPQFGYAIVIPPKGAQVNAYAMNTVVAPGMAGAVAQMVDGHPLEVWRASNPTMTNEQFLAHPKFAPFHAQIQAEMVAGNLAAPGVVQPGNVVVNQPAGANAAAFNNTAY